jgi:uncharacterized protein
MKLRHLLWLLLAIPIALGVWRLRFDVEVMNLLPDDFPVVRGLKLYQTEFANARELIITVSAKDAETTENAARTVALALRGATNLVTEAVWQPLWLERPSESAELIAYLWLNQPPEVFSEVTSRLALTNVPQILREAQEALTTSFSPQDLARRGYDPLNLTQLPESVSGGGFNGEGEFFASADGTFRIVFAEARGDLTDYRKCTKWLNEVKSVVSRALDTSGIKGATVLYTGRPAFVSEISSGMQQDLAGPSGATLFVIGLLFYITHRRIKPLLWLIVLLLLILGGTVALGGLVFGTLNVISLGFASILLGLAEDFGIVLYQELRSHPNASLHDIRRMAGPGIFWSSVTTCGAFLMLNFGGLPGLGQLGTLVAIGIAFAAIVMLWAFLPPLMRKRPEGSAHEEPTLHSPTQTVRWPWATTIALLVCCAAVLVVRRPSFDNSPDALRPKNSTAYTAAAQIKERMQRTQEPLWVLITGRDETDILSRLRTAEVALNRAVSNGLLTGFRLPTSFWPDAANQRTNVAAAAKALKQRAEIREAIFASGFTSNAVGLTEQVFKTWDAAHAQQSIFWPTNESSRWILEKLIARNHDRVLALGLLYRDTNAPLASLTPRLLTLAGELAPQGIYVSGWEILGYSVFARVKEQFWYVLIPMVLLVAFSLWLAYRSIGQMLLSFATLVVSGVCLWAIMAALGWSWNLLNLMALPLLLGIGVDFSIHIQLALKRHHGDLKLVRGSIGRALLLAGSTTVAGFASLAFSNNAGMASLGKVCGAGILCAMLVSVYLLPLWWHALRRTSEP